MQCSECNEKSIIGRNLDLGGNWYYCAKHALEWLAFALWEPADLMQLELDSDEDMIREGTQKLFQLVEEKLTKQL
jgi:hypothetical protein